MRTTSKPNTGKPGISGAAAYRCGVLSAATAIESLVDAYGSLAIIQIALQCEREIAEHGDAIYNWDKNLYLNSLPLPAIRKQHKPENAKKRRRK